MNKFFVIDACVPTSASDNDKPISSHSRIFLENFRIKTNYKIVLSEQLKREWLEHASLYTRKFFSSLKSRRRILYIEDIEGQFEIRYNLHKIRDQSRISAIEKDMHLIEAALLSDKIIVSSDNKARGHFSFISDTFNIIGSILWVDPTKPV